MEEVGACGKPNGPHLAHGDKMARVLVERQTLWTSAGTTALTSASGTHWWWNTSNDFTSSGTNSTSAFWFPIPVCGADFLTISWVGKLGTTSGLTAATSSDLRAGVVGLSVYDSSLQAGAVAPYITTNTIAVGTSAVQSQRAYDPALLVLPTANITTAQAAGFEQQGAFNVTLGYNAMFPGDGTNPTTGDTVCWELAIGKKQGIQISAGNGMIVNEPRVSGLDTVWFACKTIASVTDGSVSMVIIGDLLASKYVEVNSLDPRDASNTRLAWAKQWNPNVINKIG